MQIKSCAFTLIVEMPPDARVMDKDTLLDGSGFPWEVAFTTEDGKVGLKPLRKEPPTEISAIYAYEERLPVVQRNRIYDYMSQIEALDFEVNTIFANEADRIESIGPLKRDANEPPVGEVAITSGRFLWGPLALSPMEPPTKWPFRARNEAVTLEPSYVGWYDVCRTLPGQDGPLRINLPWHDAIGFARIAVEQGWDKAVATFLPYSARLTTGPEEMRIGG